MAVIRTERGHGLAFGIRYVSRVKKDTVGVICSCNNGMGCRANIATPKGEKGTTMKHKFNLYHDFIYPIFAKVIGKRYGCCDKLKNCAKCCRENGWEDWERSNNE